MLLVSCTSQPSLDELIAEAMRCVQEYSENGIVKTAPEKYQTECWAELNRREEASVRREKRREEVKNSCSERIPIKVCNRGVCSCYTRLEVADMLRRVRY